jgi:hypothetical protein
MARYELAQLNIGIAAAPLDSPQMADFMNNLDRINALAEAAPGFVWRLQTEEGNATALRPLGDETMVNMSVWTDVASLNAYVYRSAHVEIMRRRKEFFKPIDQAILVLWWVPAGHRPSTAEAFSKLELLRAQGPTPEAFNFRKTFPAPSAVVPGHDVDFVFRPEHNRDPLM